MTLNPKDSQHRILIVDDEASLRTILSTVLRREGFSVATAKDGAEALALLKASESTEHGEPFDIVISDIRMPGMDGISLLKRIARDYEDLPVIMLTAHGTVDTAVSALKIGAFDFLLKPFERDEIIMVIQKALSQRKANAHNVHVAGENSAKQALVGSSAYVRHVHELIDKIADCPSTVLITGESGTGKELIAKALHENSSRHEKPFIRINCAAIPSALLESELFGYEKGAFTGAVTSKPGKFELAHEGTLFLDEIGELPIDMQVKLLRVLQESTFERVGGIRSIHVDIRLIAATNRNLQQAILDNKFREDLFYRLNVVPISLAPLRDRSEDIPLLVEHFVHKHNIRLGKQVTAFSEDALLVLKSYNWPGNIRELENIVERTLLFSDHCLIEAGDLPPEICNNAIACKHDFHTPASSILPALSPDAESSMKDAIKKARSQLERELILKALASTQANVTHAAKKLKISRKSLQLKMKELGLREDGDFMFHAAGKTVSINSL